MPPAWSRSKTCAFFFSGTATLTTTSGWGFMALVTALARPVMHAKHFALALLARDVNAAFRDFCCGAVAHASRQAGRPSQGCCWRRGNAQPHHKCGARTKGRKASPRLDHGAQLAASGCLSSFGDGAHPLTRRPLARSGSDPVIAPGPIAPQPPRPCAHPSADPHHRV